MVIIIIITIIIIIIIIIVVVIIIIIPKQLKLNFPLKYIWCPYCSVIKWWLVHKFSSLFAPNKQRFPSKRVEALFEPGTLRRCGVCQYLLPAVVRSWSRNKGLQTIISLLSACPVICICYSLIPGSKHRYMFDKSVVAKQMSIVEAFGLLLFRVDKGNFCKKVVEKSTILKNELHRAL